MLNTKYDRCQAGARSVPELPPDIEYRAWNKDEHVIARVCGISVQTMRRWRAAGEGPPFKRIGSHVRYSLAATFEWLESLPEGGAE